MIGFSIKTITAKGVSALKQAVDEEPQELAKIPQEQRREFNRIWKRYIKFDPEYSYVWQLNPFCSIGVQYYTAKKINQEPARQYVSDINKNILEMVKDVHKTLVENGAVQDVDYVIEVNL